MSTQLSVGERKFLDKQRKNRENPFSRHFESEEEALYKMRKALGLLPTGAVSLLNGIGSDELTPEDLKVIDSMKKNPSSRNVSLEDQVNNTPGVFGSPVFRRLVSSIAGAAAGLFVLLGAPHYDVIAQNSTPVLKVIQYAKSSGNSLLNTSSKAVVKGDGISIDDLLGPVKSFIPNPDWYKLENQPDSAIKTTTEQVPHTVERKVSVFIGKTYALVNGVETTLDAPPEIIPPGRTYVPVRFVAENLGYQVGWDAKERKVTLSTADKLIELWIGKKYAVVDGVKISLDSAPFIDPKYNRTYLPFRWLAEQLGATVSWDPNDPMGRKASFDLVKTTYTTIQHKEINPNSDADKDKVPFDIEKLIGTDPNNAHTISKLVPDGYVAKWEKKYKITLKDLENYKPKNGLSIEANVLLGFNSNTAFNITASLTDRQALELYKSLGHDTFTSKNDVFNALHDFLEKLIDDNFNKNYGTLNYEKTVVTGVFEAVKLGYVKPDKDSIIDAVKSINKELFDMLDNRAFKDGKTLDDFVAYYIASDPHSPRILSLAALNSVFGENPINLLLAQSTQLQELVKTGELNKAKDFINIIYSAVNSEVPGMNVTEIESTPFKEAVNQMVDFKLGKYNAANLMFSVYNQALKDEELMSIIKSHPKMFFAFTDYLGKFLSNEQALDEDKKAGEPVVMDEVIKLAVEHIKYQAWGEKQRQQMKSLDGSPIISTNLEKMSIGKLMLLINTTYNAERVALEQLKEGKPYDQVLEGMFGWVKYAKTIFELYNNTRGVQLNTIRSKNSANKFDNSMKWDPFSSELGFPSFMELCYRNLPILVKDKNGKMIGIQSKISQDLVNTRIQSKDGYYELPVYPRYDFMVKHDLFNGSPLEVLANYAELVKSVVGQYADLAKQYANNLEDHLKNISLKVAQSIIKFFEMLDSLLGFGEVEKTMSQVIGMPIIQVPISSSNYYGSTKYANAHSATDVIGELLLQKGEKLKVPDGKGTVYWQVNKTVTKLVSGYQAYALPSFEWGIGNLYNQKLENLAKFVLNHNLDGVIEEITHYYREVVEANGKRYDIGFINPLYSTGLTPHGGDANNPFNYMGLIGVQNHFNDPNDPNKNIKTLTGILYNKKISNRNQILIGAKDKFRKSFP